MVGGNEVIRGGLYRGFREEANGEGGEGGRIGEDESSKRGLGGWVDGRREWRAAFGGEVG